jgi:DNA transposition AAA+ family ATPase
LDRLAAVESAQLLRRAHKLGIEVPETGAWWDYELVDGGKGSRQTHLSEFGKVKVAKLIREEKLKNVEQWIKLIAPILTALTGLLGVIIGLIAILRK